MGGKDILDRMRPADAPFGRWLGDFAPLSRVEQDLVAAAATGTFCRPSACRPDSATDDNRIRAELVRFLALGGDDKHPVHEAGVQIAGAWITGPLRLSACEVGRRLNLIDCVMDAPLHAFDARIWSLNLSGSKIAGLRADRIEVRGNVTLRGGFTSDSTVSLVEAKIGGGLDVAGALLAAADQTALDASGAVIGGHVNLGNGFRADGTVRIVGARIGGDLIGSHGRFDGQASVAIGADAVRVEGNALFEGAMMTGAVRLAGADIGGHLSLDRVCISGDPLALQAEHLVVGHALMLREASIAGQVMMTDAQVAALADDLDSWPAAQVVLDGFRYARISGHGVSSEMRIAWLERQVPADIGDNFRPQPWEQLIRVLRDMGHSRGATLVAMEKQRALRRAGRIGNQAPRPDFPEWWTRRPALMAARQRFRRGLSVVANHFARLLHDAYGLFAGFGYRPERIVVWMIGVWIGCALIFAQAAREGVIAPAEPTLLIAALDGTKRPSATAGPGDCGVRNEVRPDRYWYRCAGLPSEYPHFNAWLFSADLILPVVDFRQFAFWAPAATYITAKGEVRPMTGGMLSKVVQWFEVLFGWTMSLLFGAIVTRLVERD